jgi:hypothetical protein
MPTTKLTQAAVERPKAPEQGRMEYWDSQLPGFGLLWECRHACPLDRPEPTERGAHSPPPTRGTIARNANGRPDPRRCEGAGRSRLAAAAANKHRIWTARASLMLSTLGSGRRHSSRAKTFRRLSQPSRLIGHIATHRRSRGDSNGLAGGKPGRRRDLHGLRGGSRGSC